MEECGFLKLPEEVFYGYLFPYLKRNDLLRLRRVSKQIKIYSDDYIRHRFTNPEVEINETDQTLTDFLRLDLPPSVSPQIYLNNPSGPAFFESPEIPEFLQLYASSITHLRVNLFSACDSEAENSFFSALTSLQHLDLETIDLTPQGKVVPFQKISDITGTEPTPPKTEEKGNKFPSTFRNLKTLKLNQIRYDYINDNKYLKDLINFCPNLEFLRHPQQYDGINGMLQENGPFNWATDYIANRDLKFPDQPNLKFYDLLHCQISVRGAADFCHFMFFVKLCYDYNVKTLNVDSDLLELCWVHPIVQQNFLWSEYSWPVTSMRNVRRSLFTIEIPYMTELVITRTSCCSFGRVWLGDIPYWPGLKRLDLTIDSEELEAVEVEDGEIERTLSLELLAFLFASVPREELRELSIRFEECWDEVVGLDLPCPRAQDIAQNCGNVTKLTLINWWGTNKALSKLWSGLRHLEEVSLEDCRTLGNVAFVGTDKEDPTFLKLTKLKKFTLSGVDRMPKITDFIFELVFRHLKIKQFILKSAGPIKSVTVKGIRSLLSGEFSNHVERFPFSGWSLHNISEDEFSQLKSEFRSSHMM